MNLRGTRRLALAATALTAALLVGGLGAPAYAEEGEDPGDIDFPGATLLLDQPVWAANAPVKGCAGIDTGTAVPGKDGWLFSRPEGRYTDLQYVFLFVKGDGETIDDLVPLVLNADGVFTFAEPVDPGNPEVLAKSLQANAKKASALAAGENPGGLELPTGPAPAGVSGKLTDGGGWIRTPAGWALAFGGAFTEPMLEGATFTLVRACAAGGDTTPSPAASPTPGGPSLPVTGTNVWLLSGAGVALVAVGAVLFLAYRRRQSVKFVA